MARHNRLRSRFRPRIESLEERVVPTIGHLDPTLNAAGTPGEVLTSFFSNDQGNAVVVQPDGKVVVAGSSSFLGHTHMTVFRYNPDGSPDLTFGDTNQGHETVIFDPTKDDAARAVALEPDGKIVVAGYANDPNTNLRAFALARLNPDGTLDKSFDGGSGKNDGLDLIPFGGASQASGLAIQNDGKIVVAGQGTSLGIQGFQVERLDPVHGALDLNFGNNKTGGTFLQLGSATSAAYAVALTPDGNIVLAGYALDNGNEAFALAEVQGTGPNAGQLNAGFGNIGEILTPSGEAGADAVADAVTVQADGKIVAAGGIGNGSEDAFLVTRYDTSGKLDQGFGTGGRAAVNFGFLANSSGDFAHAVKIDADGDIVAAGDTGKLGSQSFALLRLTPDGKRDLSFGFGGTVESSFPGTMNARASGVGFSPDGKIVVAGSADSNFALARYENDHLQFGAPAFAGSEDSGMATVTVTRTGGTTGTVSAVVGVTGGTAIPGQDYVYSPQTVTFADGVTSQTITIPVVKSMLMDGTKTIQLSLSSPAGARLGAQTTTTVFVADGAPPVNPMPPAHDVTAQVKVSLGKPRRIRGTQRFRQVVTLTNVGPGALAGPLRLVLVGLPKRAKALTLSGLTHALAKPGSPFVVVDPGPGPIPPGAVRTLEIRFRSPSAKQIVYTPVVLAGVGIP
jgi:uncharacterized delta-60 repeat protein